MNTWQIILTFAGLAGALGVGAAVKRRAAKTGEILDLGKQVAHGIVALLEVTGRTAAAAEFSDWTDRIEALLKAMGLEATPGQMAAAAREAHGILATYNIARAQGDLALTWPRTEEAMRRWKEWEAGLKARNARWARRGGGA